MPDVLLSQRRACGLESCRCAAYNLLAVAQRDDGAFFDARLLLVGHFAGVGDLFAVVTVHLADVGGQQQVGKGIGKALLLVGREGLPARPGRTDGELLKIKNLPHQTGDLFPLGRARRRVGVGRVLDAVEDGGHGFFQRVAGRACRGGPDGKHGKAAQQRRQGQQQ